MTILIQKQKAAANSIQKTIASDRYNILASFRQGATIRVIGGVLESGEYVKLQYNDGGSWRDAVVGGNGGKILDENNSVSTIDGRMINMRVSKSVTAADIGVEVV